MDKQAVQIIKDYVEGRMDITAFKHEFDTNNKLKKTLNLRKKKHYGYTNECGTYDYIKLRCKNEKIWYCLYFKYVIWWHLKDWLDFFQYPYQEYTKYNDDYDILLDIQPSWLDASTNGILDKIVQEMPKGLSKAKRKEWGIARIKELFKWDKTYPRWVQDPEWPVVDGKPLVFRGQERAKGGDIRTFFYFYDPETGKEVTVEQFT